MFVHVVGVLELLTDPQAWVSLATLTALEIVLGIDNIVFVAILVGKLPQAQQKKARFIGLGAALVGRLALLGAINALMALTKPLTPEIFGRAFSGRDLILGIGGLFLLAKSTHEIFANTETGKETPTASTKGFASVLIQILLLDLVFSLDSVITAVGMAQQIEIMMAAVVIAVIVMLVFSGPVAAFVERHPSVKILALSFLLLVGVMLVAEALGQHINRGYIYFAIAFSLAVELLNIRMRKASDAKLGIASSPR